ncbi:AAA family ATPase [Variovorax sp. RT4R15]|uniref:AAA family ATPase n=1 Tax=Variovorax sp. RT4R15 TaxID=3443737 RepID=UPI003F449EA9
MAPDAPYLIVYPSSDRFNDFGTASRVEYLVARGGKMPPERLLGKMLVAQQDAKQAITGTSDFLERAVRAVNDNDELAPLLEALDGYFYLGALLDSDQYQKLIFAVGRRNARELLAEAHDLAVLQIQADRSRDVQFFRGTRAYGQSLLRLDSTFIAVFGFANQLAGTKRLVNRLERPETIEVEEASLEKGSLRLSFLPDALGINRINVLVGPNGTGKTKFLKVLVADSPVNSHGPMLFIPSPLDEPVAFEKAGSVQIQAHPATVEGWAALTRLLTLILRSDTQYKQLERAVDGFIELDQIMVPIGEAADVNDSITALIREQRYVRLAGLANAPEGKKTEIMGWVDLDLAPLVATQTQARALSSGERALLGMSCILLAAIPQAGLVLLDEPELSLHPRMIAELMKLLGFLLETRNAHCVIATHPLYVVRETPSSAVHVLKRSTQSGKIQDYEPMLQTLGAGLTELSNVIFDDWEIHEYFERRVGEFVARKHSPEEIEAASRELGESARVSLYEQLRKGRDEVA